MRGVTEVTGVTNSIYFISDLKRPEKQNRTQYALLFLKDGKNMKQIYIEPLKGEMREKRLVLDWVSTVVFVLDFIKSRMGQKGVVEAGEHSGSIEKLAWKNILPKLSPESFWQGLTKETMSR